MTPIPTLPLDTLVGVSVPTGKPPAPPEAAAVNWFLTWLGQMGEVPVETLPEEVESKTPPAAPVPAESLQQPVHWLTLLPSVPAFQPFVLAPAPGPPGVQDSPEKEKEKKTLPTASLLPAAPAQPDDRDVEPEPDVPNAAAVELALVPVAAELPKPPVPAPTPEMPAVQLESHSSALPAPLTPAPAAPAPQPVQHADKGEVIWSAELVAKASPSPVLPDAKPISSQAGPPPVLAPLANAGAGEQSSGRQGAPFPRRGFVAAQPIAPGQPAGQPVDQAAPLGPEETAQPGVSATEPRNASPDKATAPARRESRASEPPPETAPEPKPLEFPGHTSFPAEFHPRAANSREASPEPAAGVNTVNALDSAAPRPLRPAQIATLQVDVPSAAGSDSAAPMRLIVSQRGEQVNVRLRSWDPSVQPLESGQMQPLLHSLNEKGFSAAAELTEPNLAYLDRPHEKPLAAAESSSAGNDQQTFLGDDSRQQQNQERQQQQQAFFLRKQMRNLQSGNFDPGLVLAGNPLSQQGAVR